MEPQEWQQSENDWTGKRGNSRCEVEKACERRRSRQYGNCRQNLVNQGACSGNRRDVDSLSKFAVGAKNSKRGASGREVVGGEVGKYREGEPNLKRGLFGESLPRTWSATGIPEGSYVRRASRPHREQGTQYPCYFVVRYHSEGEGNIMTVQALR
jgi:hypothetical protein